MTDHTPTPEAAVCGARHYDADAALLTCHLPLGHHTLHRAHTTPGERHTWADVPTETSSEVRGYCPACGGTSLFLGDGGYVTCSRLECPQPDAASTLLETDPRTTPEAPATNPCRATYETPTARTIRQATEEAESAKACERETFADLAAERAAHEEHRRQLADALGLINPRAWAEMIDQVGVIRTAATERAAALHDARDALGAAGHGPDGDDWPAIAPAIRALAADLAQASATADAYAAADSADAAAGSYAHRAEQAEAERDRLAAALVDARYETEGETKRADRAEQETRAARTRAELAEGGREAADVVIRATLAALGAGPDVDPVIRARETLTRAEKAEAQVRDYENRTTWETTCGEHARLLDACRVADEHTERAEATIARVRDAVVQWRGWNPTENAWAIRDIERALSGDPDPRPQDPAALDGEQPDAGPEPESEAAMSFTDAVETATEEEVSGPDPDESEKPCFHPAWETTDGARKCTDCGEWLDPQPLEPGDTELTADEARAEVDRLATDLYQAQDALAFVAEMCNIADREGTPVTTARVRDWLKGAQCARQAGLVVTHGPVVDAVRQALARR